MNPTINKSVNYLHCECTVTIRHMSISDEKQTTVHVLVTAGHRICTGSVC
jgi:hypothetical protein